MKKVLATLAIAILSMASLFAQDMESATALYNEGATALNAGDKETALGYFEEALAQAELIGPEAEELAYNCKRNIPTLINLMQPSKNSARLLKRQTNTDRRTSQPMLRHSFPSCTCRKAISLSTRRVMRRP